MLRLKLGIKNIPKKKIITYVILISLSIAGTAFFINQNHKITSGKNIESTLIEREIETSASLVEKTKAITTKAIESLDISIFNSDKFKALKEVIFREKPIEAGRDNPFEDPFKE